MKTNIKLTVYLTTAIMSETLAKRLVAIKPAGLAGIYDATFTRVILERDDAPHAPLVDEWPLCSFQDTALRLGNNSMDKLYCERVLPDV